MKHSPALTDGAGASPLPRREEQRHGEPRKSGFTIIELTVVIGVISVLAVIGFAWLQSSMTSAYNITAEHDLQNFARAEESNFLINNTLSGSPGQQLKRQGGQFTVEGFTPSKMVTITIVAGDPADPYDAVNPYVVKAVHEKGNRTYEYNFLFKKILEK